MQKIEYVIQELEYWSRQWGGWETVKTRSKLDRKTIYNIFHGLHKPRQETIQILHKQLKKMEKMK